MTTRLEGAIQKAAVEPTLPPQSGPRRTAEEEAGLQVILQHRRLLDALSSLEEFALDILVEPGEWCARCEESLAELIGDLEAHFIAEVATTSSEQVARRNPALAARLRSLDAEHPVLLEKFQSARRLLWSRHVRRDDVRSALLEAARAFREHEAEENVLFFELF